MYKPAIYVETSVWNHAFAEDAPESRRATWDFLRAAFRSGCELHVSDIVVSEIARAPDALARRLQQLIQEYEATFLEYDEEADALAQEFLRYRIVPPGKMDDARHVAVATVNELDMLVSWNYRHLVNVRKKEAFQHIAAANGYYRPLHIVTPLEVGNEIQ